jgi:peptidoglycan/xylan/chitin deacetylase (PgdA/CDA1 family)
MSSTSTSSRRLSRERYGRRPWGTRAPVVLMYHGFAEDRRDDDPENLFVPVRAFEEQLDHLLAHGWTPLDLDGYLAARRDRRAPRKSFLVTIDDGLESVATLAAPVLASRSVPFVLFVCAGLMGRTAWWLPQPADSPILCAEALTQLLEQAPMEIGGHGYDHVHMLEMSTEELTRQTGEVKSILQEVSGAPVRAFAYPYGSHDADARDAVQAAGYDIAFSVFDDKGRLAISRVDVNATDTLASFRLKLIPHYRTWWRAMGRLGVVRRGVRRILETRDRARGRQERAEQ